MKPRVAVTAEEFEKARAVFESAGQFDCSAAPSAEADLAEAIRETAARHAIVGPAPYFGPLYEALPAGGVIARFGVGHDGIDKGLAAAAGLICTNTPGALDASVAEYAIALLLAAARHVGRCSALMQRGEWMPSTGHELAGKRLAILGCGPIGQHTARIASFGLGMAVTGWKRTQVSEAEWRREWGYERVTASFATAVADADFVILLLPGVPETRHFLNRERLSQLPAGAWLVNVARGSVVDETALFDALREGRLAGAATDVYQTEPYVPADPAKDLRQLDNVLLMPHCGSNTREANAKMARQALRNLELAETGRFAEMNVVGGRHPGEPPS